MQSVIALVGRPNVGKSTLFNRLTRRRDALVADVAGLTRDRRYGVADFGDLQCTLIDTGGLFDATAVGSLMAKQASVAIDEADLVLFLVDARAGLTPTDIDIAQQLRKHDRKVLLVVNKIDGATVATADAEFARLGFTPQIEISAAHGRGMGSLQDALLSRTAAHRRIRFGRRV